MRIRPDEYHPTVNAVLRDGFTLTINAEGSPEISKAVDLKNSRWGFNAEKLRNDGMSIAWPDQELLFFLRWCFYDYFGETAPVNSFSPPQQKAGDAGE